MKINLFFTCLNNTGKFHCRLIILIFIFGIQQVSAQHSFNGTVTDKDENTLPGAQVLLSVKDSLYARALTDTAGNFSIQNLQAGDYLLNIISLGFIPLKETVQIKEGDKEPHHYMLEIGDAFELDSVAIVSNLSNIVTRTATGQIFRLSEQAKNSGDPYRALNEIPLLRVNEALRTITMNDGSTPLILINGMPVNSGVAPIDPKDIASVEVMDVVQARYLRTGAKHILNIKLKEKRNPYTFFEVMTRHDIPLRMGMGAVYFEVGNSKYSLYGRGAGNYTYDDNAETEGWQRSSDYYKQSSGEGQTNSHYFLGELLFKWMFTKKDFLVAHVYAKYDKSKAGSDGNGEYQTNEMENFYYSSLNRNNSDIWTGTLYHKHVFSEHKLLETTLAYNGNRNNDDGERDETYPDQLYQNMYEYKNQRSSGSLNIDYSWDWNEVNSLNIGSETKYLNDRIHQVSDNLPIFHHREWSQYLYAAFSSKFKKLYYMGSLGIESIWLKAGDVSGNYIKPRASVSATFMFNDNNSVQAGYTLTNTAPEIGQLNPYNTSTDSLVITRGNPDLLPQQDHNLSLSYTFNKFGLYVTPYFGYNISTDIIEPFGYSENGIYLSTYRNTGKFSSLTAGGSVAYRLGKLGRIYMSAYHSEEYYSGQDPRKSFTFNPGMNLKYKKWYFGVDYSYQDYTYTAVSRTKYRTPNYSLAQLQYNFTPNFYISIGLQYFTGAVRLDTETFSENYRSFISQKMLDQNVRPWVLIRYTFRKNTQQKIKIGNSITSKEKGISL